MKDQLSTILKAFDAGRLSRRQFLPALGAFALVPASAPAAPAPRTPKRGGWIGTPPTLPFEATGWKTVLLDHLSCRVADPGKEAAYYNALMNWAVRQDSGNEVVLDIGDWGGVILRGGYQPSASEVAAERAQYERRAARARTRGIQMPPFVPRNAVFDHVCWGIEPWDARTVEAALKARGLSPVADNHGDFESFHVKDPDGFDLQISNGNRQNRRTTLANASLAAAAPFAHTDWKTIWLDHMSYQCSDYKRTVAFYQALLGWQPYLDFGDSNQVRIGNVGDTIIRNHFGGGDGVLIDHISFGIAPFNYKEVKAALEQRGLPAGADTGGPEPIETAPYKSYHTLTPNGFDLQISNADSVNRGES